MIKTEHAEACRKNKICFMHVNMVDTPVLTDILEYVHALYSGTLPTINWLLLLLLLLWLLLLRLLCLRCGCCCCCGCCWFLFVIDSAAEVVVVAAVVVVVVIVAAVVVVVVVCEPHVVLLPCSSRSRGALEMCWVLPDG